MNFERIGAHGIKIILDHDEAELLYRRLSEKGSSEGQMLIAAILASAQEQCALSFSSSEFNVEILDSAGGAVIYITEIKPYYYLSQRRGFTLLRKTSKQLFCSFDDPEKLLRFIKAASGTFLNSPSSRLYTSGTDFIVAFGSRLRDNTQALLSEFGAPYSYGFDPLPEEYEMIIERDAVRTIGDLLYKRSPPPYHQKQTGSCPKR